MSSIEEVKVVPEPTVGMSAQEFLQKYQGTIDHLYMKWSEQERYLDKLWDGFEADILDYALDAWHNGYLPTCWEGFLATYGRNYWAPFLPRKKPPLSAWRKWRTYAMEYRSFDDFLERSRMVDERRQSCLNSYHRVEAKTVTEWSRDAVEMLVILLACAKDNPTCQVNIPVTLMVLVENCKDMMEKAKQRESEGGENESGTGN